MYAYSLRILLNSTISLLFRYYFVTILLLFRYYLLRYTGNMYCRLEHIVVSQSVSQSVSQLVVKYQLTRLISSQSNTLEMF